MTGGHGVRFQHDYTGDLAGPRNASWVRLARSGSTVTGYASADGATWTRIGSVRLPGLPASAEAGVFVTSPAARTLEEHVGRSEGTASSTTATATFTDLSVAGTTTGDWSTQVLGDPAGPQPAQDAGGQPGPITLTGTGDIAPTASDGPGALERTLVGTFAGLTVLVVLAALMITSEYRRGMIRSTFAATPHRVRVLAAKSLVAGAVAFVITLIAATAAVPWARHILIHNNVLMVPVGTATEIRMLLGTAALVAVAAVFALALGTLLRRGAGAVTIVVVLIVLPYLLASSEIVPSAPADWLLRLTPAAAFAVQQTLPLYPQIDAAHTPALGYFPLSPWSGFAVLCVWTAAALALAAWSLRRRDA
jgi:ABC-type transport system involved in multi-copper enzyme maturation permease subunit